MTKTRIFTSLIIVSLFVFGFSFSTSAQTTGKKAAFTKAEYSVNLHCESCKEKVGKSLAYTKGVKTFYVDLDNKKVGVTYDPAKTSNDKIIKSIAALGYTVSAITPSTHKCPSGPTNCPNASPKCSKEAGK